MKTVRIWGYLLLMIFAGPKLWAQPTEADSIRQLIKEATTLSTKANLYHKLAEATFYTDMDLAWAYSDTAMDLATTALDTVVFVKGLQDKAWISKMRGDRAGQLHYTLEGLKLGEQIQDTSLMMFAWYNLSVFHFTEKDFPKSLSYANQLLNTLVARSDSVRIGIVQNLIGSIYLDMKDYPAARNTLLEALATNTATENDVQVLAVLFNLGTVASHEDNVQEAMDYFQEAATLNKKMQDVELSIEIPLKIARLHQEHQEFAKASEKARIARDLAAENQYLPQEKEALEILVKSEEGLRNFHDAFHLQQELMILKDSLMSEAQRQAIVELNRDFEISQRDKENQILKDRQELLENHKTRDRTISAALAVLLLVVIILMYRNNQLRKKHNIRLEAQVEAQTRNLINTNQELLASNQQLERFAFIASHDLKEPVRVISSFVGLIQRKKLDQLNPQLQTYVAQIGSSARQVYELINSILEFSRVGNQAVQLQPVNLQAYFTTLRSAILDRFDRSPAEIIVGSSLPELMTDPQLLDRIFINLIENGLKFNESELPTVTISATSSDDYTTILVSDNGIGIPDAYKADIFEMFTRLHDRSSYEGAGMGLAIVHRAVELLQGSIILADQPAGTAFEVRIPVNTPVKPSPEPGPSAQPLNR